ncbi:hypothetical protein [Nocardia iowensis]|uniref:Uncharacterized protein n=1 Tax=Nocardia iowensis TaxID=204891 RepID=A0ABX8RU28_NOCIO|nr:hypothetical protein [Nocardia iowensis]QXN91905.1 hypothetical protein KV110_01550 [Nocardia iowensis]
MPKRRWRAGHESCASGKHADFVPIDQDPFSPEKPLWQTEVLQSWGGARRLGEYGRL